LLSTLAAICAGSDSAAVAWFLHRSETRPNWVRSVCTSSQLPHLLERALHATIVIPMKNTERWIGYALSSVLSQDYKNIDVIVVDDGSTDASRERALRAGDSRVRVVDNVGTGIAAAWNLGASLARGELLMRCDSDDVLPPTRVSSHASWLGRHPEVGALAGACTGAWNCTASLRKEGRGVSSKRAMQWPYRLPSSSDYGADSHRARARTSAPVLSNR